MIPVLRRRPLPREVWLPAAIVAGLGLVAHLLDYVVTLRLSPDLAMEANPIWRIVVDGFGLPIAKAYGLTGKILVSVLSFELFAWYLQTRRDLLPASAAGPADFLRGFGKETPRRFGVAWKNLFSVFAFVFALLGPYFFYVVLLNSLEDDARLRSALPSPIPAIAVYLVALVAAYFAAGWRAFRRSQSRRR